MSVFGKIFGGGKKQPPAATPQESIQKLRETEEMLVKKQEFLEKKIEAKPTWFSPIDKFENIRVPWIHFSGKIPLSVEGDVDALETDLGYAGPPFQRL
uniref:Uncharacterized protein n=1 Tax=Parascaris equorum TaxID=6256 RepID=A0A914RF18_PAREQ